MIQEKKFAEDLIDFIYASPNPFHAVRNVKAALLRKGFKQLDRGFTWNLEKGGKYFSTKNDSALVAFTVGTGKVEEKGFKIIAAHTDSPCLKIKPFAELISDKNYLKLNVETYGGAILSTWLDRPLSMAGRIVLRSSNPLEPETKFINIKKPILIIPNLAIHFNREVNENKVFNKQIDMIPIAELIDREFSYDNYLKKLLSEHLNCEFDQILDFDLFLYEFDKGNIIGVKDEFISSSRLDNLAMVHAGVEALLESEPSETSNVMACFDNEETGSMTKQGAASPFMKDVLRRVSWAINTQRDAFYRAKTNSFAISADMAHAVHPNFPEKHDPVLRPQINQGPVIKINANQKYTTDAVSGAVFEMLCQKAGVPFQRFVNRSDIVGGSTLGSISTTQMDIRTVDVGSPLLAMHSIRELSGVLDHYYMKRVFEKFFSL
jgi:aspartyl aminopeptidase